MTRNDIIRMAREAGIGFGSRPPVGEVVHLQRFAALVAAAEREACAKEIDPTPGDVYDSIDLATRLRLAAAMRKRHLHPAGQNE